MNPDQELCWLAGLLEGEGCFGAYRSNKGYLQIRVEIQMTDMDVVRRAAVAFPGADRITSRAPSLTNCPGAIREIHHTRWCGPNAYRLMWAVLPYMGERRTDRILTCLADYLEYQMEPCMHCGVEFSRMSSTRRMCSDECGLEYRRAYSRNYQRELREARRAV